MAKEISQEYLTFLCYGIQHYKLPSRALFQEPASRKVWVELFPRTEI